MFVPGLNQSLQTNDTLAGTSQGKPLLLSCFYFVNITPYKMTITLFCKFDQKLIVWWLFWGIMIKTQIQRKKILLDLNYNQCMSRSVFRLYLFYVCVFFLFKRFPRVCFSGLVTVCFSFACLFYHSLLFQLFLGKPI